MHNYKGAVDCMKEVDQSLWSQAVLDESQSPPPFYSSDFEVNALQCIDELGIQIVPANMKSVYIYLLENV